MKKFLIKISIFAVVLYGLAWGLDYAISKGLYQMDDYRFMSWSEIWGGDINADILVMGNSRALSHFEPWTIDSITGMTCYNLGIGGYPINVEEMKYHFYRLHNKKPRLILQQVDYMTISCIDAPHQHQSEQYLPLIYDRDMHDELKRVGYKWLDIHFPLYRYWGYQMVIKNGLLEFFGIKHYVQDPSRQGIHYEKGKWTGSVQQAKTINVTLDEAGKVRFEAYLQHCAEEGIDVILINSPMYVGATVNLAGQDAVNLYFDSLANVYNTVYWNYTEGYEICEDTANFVMSVHMNPQATHRFSIDIGNRLLDKDAAKVEYKINNE